MRSPFRKPFQVSRRQTRDMSNISTSPRAMERTVTASVCAPVFPPMPAIIGMNTASTGKTAMSESKNPTTADATNAVHRFTSSHGERWRMLEKIGSKIPSSAPAPAIFWMSSVFSSRMMSITSSCVMMPSSSPSESTTGSVWKFVSAIMWATISLSIVGARSPMSPVRIMCPTREPLGASSSARIDTTPCNTSSESTTYR